MRAPAGSTLLAAVVALLATPPADVHAQAGSVIGTVFDSIAGVPLADAAVFLWETPHRAVSDEEGRFTIEGVPPGDYSILFFHTRLGELGISPGPRAVVVEAGDPAHTDLAVPSMRTVLTSQCLMEERPPGVGVVAGWIEDADSGMRLGGTQVTLSWTAEGPGEPDRLYLLSGPGGWYSTCYAPADVPILAAASFYGRESLRLEVEVGEGGYAEAPLQLFPVDLSDVAGRLVDSGTGRSVEGARVWLRGTEQRAMTDGRGRFDLGEVAPGTYMLMSEHLAYGTKMDTLVVPAGVRLQAEMRLDTRPIEIAPVTVTVRAPEPISASMAGGIRITSEQIESVRQNSRDASDILRSLHLPGVVVRHRSNGTICVGYITGQVKMNQTGCVEMLIFINDVRATSPDLALRLPPDGIERMTIYKPLEAGNLFGLGAGNGVWMIYTKGN